MTMPVFKPATAMTFATAEADRLRLLACCRDNDKSELIVDLSEVTHCDSAGLALLIESKRVCREYQKSCKITGMNPAILSLAEFCGVQNILAS